MKLLVLFITLSTYPMTPPPARPLTPYSEPPIGLQDAVMDFDLEEEDDLRQKLVDGPRAMPVKKLIDILQDMAYLTGCSNPDC